MRRLDKHLMTELKRRETEKTVKNPVMFTGPLNSYRSNTFNIKYITLYLYIIQIKEVFLWGGKLKLLRKPLYLSLFQ